MPWPDDGQLPVEVWAAFGADLSADPDGWSWTDLTGRLLATPISSQTGQNGSGGLSPGTCAVTLLNDDGHLTPLHPMSPWWPHVDLGTPFRVRLRRAWDAFDRTVTGGWGPSPSGQAWSVTQGPAGDASVAAGIARHSHSSIGSSRRTTLASALRRCEQVMDVSVPAAVTGAAVAAGPVFRHSNGGQDYYWARVEFSPSGGVSVRITRSVGGVVTHPGALTAVPGLTYTPGGWLRVRAVVDGPNVRVRVWPAAGVEPAVWHLTVTDTAITAAGAAGVQSLVMAGNTNALPFAVAFRDYALRVDRASGYADQWELTYAPATGGQMHSAVRVTFSGITRRLQQGKQPVSSPVRRTIAASRPVAYWTAEDGAAASQLGSPVPDVPPARIVGPYEFVDVEPDVSPSWTRHYGVATMVDLARGATVTGQVPAHTAGPGWAVWCMVDVDPTTMQDDVVVARWTTPGGTHSHWEIRAVKTGLRTQLLAYPASGGAAITVVNEAGVTSGLTNWCATAEQVGTSIRLTFGNFLGPFSIPGTLGKVAQASLNALGTTQLVAMPAGHLAVWATPTYPDGIKVPLTGNILSATYGYRREDPEVRLARLLREDAIPFVSADPSALTGFAMGRQLPADRDTLYRECVEVGGGLLYEHGFGYGYVPLRTRYRPQVAMTIDMATYQVRKGAGSRVLRPALDDRSIRNEWTASRPDGSSAVAADKVSTATHGVYSDEIELNLAEDDRLGDHASWREHLHSTRRLEEATIPIDLAANPSLIDAWLSCDIGALIRRNNLPAQHHPRAVDVLAMGWQEQMGPNGWEVQVTPAAAEPWDVAVAGGPYKAVAEATTLAGGGLNATALTFALTTATGFWRWTTNPADFPLDVFVGGEQMTLSGITGTSNNQTATVAARGVNGIQRAWPAGTPLTVARRAVAAL
ncbi:hypothetical protein [Verrucosispora sp. TAA-831]|uniref:hypothetical protein n=1 Tax=Verrucosispora sp. TAA-831 TaxID=3422227 RepID=UPI003D6E4FCA